MITKEIKISKLLKEYPGSLNILLQTSPHFSKLKNKVLRKALAGRVTIEQAASIAGVGLEHLLGKLNELNISASSSSSSSVSQREKTKTCGDEKLKDSEKPEYLKSVTADKISFLDVRPIIDSGKDPLKIILARIKQQDSGEVLIIKNSFEPIPLYTLLGKKGFSHWTERKDEIFNVYFYSEKEGNISQSGGYPEKPALYNSSKKINENDFENVIEIDVHELQPPEPMMKILENLYRVDEKSVMLVHHHREPVLLYPKLEERGYYAYCEKIGDENFKILITREKEE